jgi:RNA polymerase sigma factor (sigma-70 family)
MGQADSDRDLIRALSTDCADSGIAEILRRHGPMVMGVCRRVLGDHHESEDAFQATFIVLIRRRHSLLLRKSLGAWLHGVALRVATKAKAMSSQREVESVIPDEGHLMQELDHAERFAWSEIGRILDEEIQRLPTKLRSAFVLCELEGRTHKDAAKEVGIPLGTFSSRVALAKEKLRRNLTRRGVTITSAGFTAALATQAKATSLTSSQIGAAQYIAKLVLAGRAATVASVGAFALALADAVGQKTVVKLLVLLSAFAVVLVSVAAAIVFPRPSIPADSAPTAPFVEAPLAAEQSFMQLGDPAFRHRTGASRLTFLPNGKMLATISTYASDCGIYLWDATTGRKLREIYLPYDVNWPRCLAASPSGRTLVVGRNDGEVTVLDVESGHLTRINGASDRAVTAIAFTPDGNLVTANMDGLVQIADPVDFGRVLRKWKLPAPQQQPVGTRAVHASAIAVSPDATRIAIGDGATGAIYIYDAQTTELKTTIEKAHGPGLDAHYPCVNHLAFIRSGRELMSGGHRLARRDTTTIENGPTNVQVLESRIWNADSGQLVRDLIGIDIAGEGFMALSPDGENFVTTDFDAVHFWHVGDTAPTRTIPKQDRMPVAGAFSPDGTTLAIPMGLGITLWDAQTAQQIIGEPYPRYSGLGSVAWSEHNSKVALGYGDGVELRDASDGMIEHHFEMGDTHAQYSGPIGASAVAFSADGRLLVAGGTISYRSLPSQGIIKTWDTVTRENLTSIRIDRPIASLSLVGDGSVVAVATVRPGPAASQLTVYALPSGEILSRFPEDQETLPDKRITGFERVLASQIAVGTTNVYLLCEDGWCFSWDYKLHREIPGFVAAQRQNRYGRGLGVGSGAFSADAKTLVTSEDGTICFWNTKTETLEHKEVVPGARHWLELGLSPDGRLLAAAEIEVGGFRADNVIRIWDVESRKLKTVLQTPYSRATSFAFSPDKSRLLTGLDRGTATIWDIRRIEQERTTSK